MTIRKAVLTCTVATLIAVATLAGCASQTNASNAASKELVDVFHQSSVLINTEHVQTEFR